ncbi:MAG: hypothetical protein HOK62_00665 [Verrucomicrobiales bacterium]|nr:hypothetical protein [Verrucomicrobiales bacterium]
MPVILRLSGSRVNVVWVNLYQWDGHEDFREFVRAAFSGLRFVAARNRVLQNKHTGYAHLCNGYAIRSALIPAASTNFYFIPDVKKTTGSRPCGKTASFHCNWGGRLDAARL